MKNITQKISLLGVICLFIIVPFQSQAQVSQEPIEILQEQLRVLLVDLVERLQNELKLLLISEQEVELEQGDDIETEDKDDESEVDEGETKFQGSKSSKAVSLGDDTIAVFTFRFQIDSFDGSFYIAEDGSGFEATLTDGEIISTVISETTARLTSDNSYEISEGDPKIFTVEVQVASSAAPGTAQSVRTTLDGVEYSANADLTGVTRTLKLGAPKYKSGTVSVIDTS